MTQNFRNVVNGELVDAASGATYDVIDPTTGEVYASAPKSGPEDVDRAYAAADAAFEGWGYATPQDRSHALLKLAGAIEERVEEINAVECKDTGKPLGVTDGGGDALRLRPLQVLRRRGPGPRAARRRASTWPTTPPGCAASRSASSAR